jgi:hypothetical protein
MPTLLLQCKLDGLSCTPTSCACCTIQGLETHLWAADLPFPIVGCISESDAGLQTAERLQSDLCSNSGGINRARRDKFLMNEALKVAGMQASVLLIARTLYDRCFVL